MHGTYTYQHPLVVVRRRYILFFILVLITIPATFKLSCCATNRKVAGSIPDTVIGIFHRHKILPIAIWPWGQFSL